MGKRQDLTGQRFGKLVVIKPNGSITSSSTTYAASLCKCDCGSNPVIVIDKWLRGGHKISCGCLRPKGEDLAGKRFGRLIVLKKADPIITTNNSARAASLCQCDCGSEPLIIRNNYLKTGDTSSCGCVKEEMYEQLSITDDLSGLRFGRLFVLNRGAPTTRINGYHRGTSFCRCDCGETCTIDNASLKGGKTLSCGCLQIEVAFQNGRNNIRYPINIAASRIVYSTTYSDGNIDYENFMRLSQYSCAYCNAFPNNKSGLSAQRNKLLSDDELTFLFRYNGLDRIDSTLAHNLNNVVPCCITCNYFKSNRLFELFKSHTIDMSKHIFISLDKHRQLARLIDDSACSTYSKLQSAISSIYRCTYSDGDLTLTDFYRLSQLGCFYCAKRDVNKLSTYHSHKVDFIYTGLDRIDNSLPHNYNNVITCCKYCNIAKNDGTIDEFLNWRSRLISNLHTWISLDATALIAKYSNNNLSLNQHQYGAIYDQ